MYFTILGPAAAPSQGRHMGTQTCGDCYQTRVNLVHTLNNPWAFEVIRAEKEVRANVFALCSHLESENGMAPAALAVLRGVCLCAGGDSERQKLPELAP